MKAIFLLTFLLSTSVLASYQGQWLGEGRFVTHRRSGQCDQVFLKIQDNESFLRIEYGNYICSDIRAEYPASTFEKSDGELYYNGEYVGTYTRDEVYLSYYDKLYQLTLSREDGMIYFQEVWEDETSSMVIKARLKQVSQ